MNDEIPQNEVTANEPVVDEPHEVVLRRFERQKRPVISNDIVVYLQE